MNALNVLAWLLTVWFLVLGLSKVLAPTPVRERAFHLGFSTPRFRMIGGLEIIAAVGIALGLVWVSVGIAAAAGLLVLLVAALVAHRRVRDRPQEMGPALISLVLVAVCLVLLLNA